jgi:rhodanese-related sulfurtransferase
VHCHHGGRSLRVVRWLREQGFSRAQSMAGGIDQWAVDIDPSLPRY